MSRRRPPRAREPARYQLVRRVFLTGLALVYLDAFTSLRAQVRGLYGRRGIVPVADWLARVRRQAPGLERYRTVPSLLWLDASDEALDRRCREGQLLAVALALGIAPRATAALLFALYLSFVTAGDEFLAFQWDALLLEAGLHAALIAPPARRRRQEPTRAEVLLMRWLVFRLHFESGLVKFRSPDRTWRRRTALRYYYETAPLPTTVGWYAHHLPRAVQSFSTRATLAIELGAPFLAFGPRRVRLAGFAAITLLQSLIALTGNYGFFNALALVLNVWMLDDAVLAPRALRAPPQRAPLWRRVARSGVAVAFGALTTVSAVPVLARGALGRWARLPRWLRAAAGELSALRCTSTYGPFSLMTTSRPEVVVEGSDDGARWKPYVFRYKMGPPSRPPRWVAPHQPRLDWQLWFAALGSPPPWFVGLLARLLEGSPDVLALLERNPFPGAPPRLVRASLYDYHCTSLATHRATGRWWRRHRLGDYFPAVRRA